MPSRVAAPPPGAREGVKSADASRLLADLMGAGPMLRREFMQSLSLAEIQQVLIAADRELGTPYGLWADDPVGFVEDVLGETIWSVPRQIMRAIVTNKRVAVPSCYGSGKTWSAARIVLWRALTQPVGPALVVTIAPKWSHVHRNLWPEIRGTHSRAKLPGQVDMAQMKMLTRDGLEKVVAYGKAVQPWDESGIQGIHCFDAETELLTDKGWKPFPEVTGAERVLTLDGDKAVWGPITEVFRHDFDGYLNLHDGVRVNFCITDNHRLVVGGREHEYKRHGTVTREQGEEIKRRRREGEKAEALGIEFGVSKWTIYDIASGRRDHALTDTTSGRRWRLIEYGKLPDHFIIRRTNTWGGGSNPDTVTFDAPQPARGRKADRLVTSTFAFKEWAAFLGWFVAEGWANEAGRIGISQSREANPVKYAEISALLDRMGIVHGQQPNELRFTSGPLASWLLEHCGIKSESRRIPECIREATPEMIEVFLEAFGKGDGSPHNHPDSMRYMTSSRHLADDLHEVLCKLGRGRKLRIMNPEGSASVMSTTGREFTRNYDTWVINDPGVLVDSDVLKENVERIRYTGKVYCVGTPLQTIMVRRKGCPMWSGNSPILTLIVDEAGGMSRVIGRNLRGMLVGGQSTNMLAIGNPPTDDEGSWFEGLCANPEAVVIPISAYSTPDFTGEQAPQCRSCPPEMAAHSLASHLVDRPWVKEAIDDNGPDSNYVQAKVHARFPKGGPGRAIPSAWIDAACESAEPEAGPGWRRLCDLGLPDEPEAWVVANGAWVRLGVDVAADGGDSFAISRLTGDLAELVHTSSGPANANPVDVAGVVLAHIRRAETLRRKLGTDAKVRVKIDGIGVGWGVAGILKAWKTEGMHDAEIIAVIVSEGTNREPESATLRPWRQRDELWLAGRALLQPSPSFPDGQIRLRAGTKVAAQLRGPSMSTNMTGFTVIESKKSMKKRGLRSPDEAEAVLLGVYEPAAKKRKMAKLISS